IHMSYGSLALSLITFLLIIAAAVLLAYEQVRTPNPRAAGASLLATTVVLGACICAFWLAGFAR
ncbi:MAG: hypothetical protein NTY38_19425, partial [Acidobacteria bacterium]|nr:hypothetical protein [Acidobacteriota bacterium]